LSNDGHITLVSFTVFFNSTAGISLLFGFSKLLGNVFLTFPPSYSGIFLLINLIFSVVGKSVFNISFLSHSLSQLLTLLHIFLITSFHRWNHHLSTHHSNAQAHTVNA